jgi:hypothetical protein
MKLANNLQQSATATVKVTLASRGCEALYNMTKM